MDADFLLTRGPDLVVIGVRMRGFSSAQARPPVVVADTDDSRIVLYLPPQHIAEETTPVTPPDEWRAQAELAGPSRVAYSVPRDFRLALDAAGVLAACTQLALRSTPPGPFDTSVELPFRLALSPESADSVPLAVEHASFPLTSGESVVGLWLTRVRPAMPGPAAGAAPPAARLSELSLVPVDSSLAATPDPPFAVPLTTNSRNLIVAMSPGAPPRSRRLELSALGGSLDAHGAWAGFRWSHRAALGRDQAVVVQEEGRLYPLGPRAIFTTTVFRDPDAALPDGSTVRPGGTLGLRVVHELEILEPVKKAPDGQTFGREFPFSTVEVQTTTFRGIGPGEVAYTHTRPSNLTDLQTSRDTLIAEAADLQVIWAPEAALPRTVDDLLNRGFEPAQRWQAINAQLGPLQDELGVLQPQVDELNRLSDALDAAQRALDQLVSGTLASEDGSVSAEIAAAQAEVSALAEAIRNIGVDFARFGAVRAAVDRLSADAANVLNNELQPQLDLPRSVDDLIAAGNEAAITWAAKQTEIARLNAQIDELAAVPATFDVFLWPTTSTGERLRFPVRLSRGENVVEVLMPLIFVKDFVLQSTPFMAEYASMQDPELVGRLEEAWNPKSFPVLGDNQGDATAGSAQRGSGCSTGGPARCHRGGGAETGGHPGGSRTQHPGRARGSVHPGTRPSGCLRSSRGVGDADRPACRANPARRGHRCRTRSGGSWDPSNGHSPRSEDDECIS